MVTVQSMVAALRSLGIREGDSIYWYTPPLRVLVK